MSLDILPTELKGSILRASPDINTLFALVQSSPTYHAVYLTIREECLKEVGRCFRSTHFPFDSLFSIDECHNDDSTGSPLSDEPKSIHQTTVGSSQPKLPSVLHLPAINTPAKFLSSKLLTTLNNVNNDIYC